jgi:protein-L-isoaspartate(D-aspartate) O-methyltransferase
LTDELAQMREQLATRVVADTRIRSERVAAALYAVPRHLFLPERRPEVAYQNEAIVTKRDETGQPISSSSQPTIMAIMLDQLDLAPGQRVLEIGAGTGYNAALISHVVGPSGQVTSVDIDPELVGQAREHLARAGFSDVTVVCADGAGGYPERAPYDRVIATVGVSDLAPAWLEQTVPQARIVVPLDVRGTQLSVAFEPADPADPGGPWTSRSFAPCGFMRMRGSLAGPERVVVLAPGLSLLLPDGKLPGDPDLDASDIHGRDPDGPDPDGPDPDGPDPDGPDPDGPDPDAPDPDGPDPDGPDPDGPDPDGPDPDGPDPDGPDIDGRALAALLAGPAVRHPTGVRVTGPGPAEVFWGLGLWLAAREPRSCRLGEERPSGRSGAPGGWLTGAPLGGPGWRTTLGLIEAGGLAILTSPAEPDRSGLATLDAVGFGPRAARLAADLAAHVQAWGEAGQRGIEGLHVDAYPRHSPHHPRPVVDALIMERPGMRFAVYHD